MSRLLLLEPDKVLGSTYQEALESVGHEVVWCRDAQTAVNTLNQGAPDLVIIELQLAKHNGIEFLYELRSYNDLQKVPVLVLTSVPLHEHSLALAPWKHIGISDYLYKPVTKLHDLIRSVDAVLPARV